MLVSAGRVGAPVRLLAKLLFLAMKLGPVVALIVALLPALSWLASFILGFVFLAGMVYLVAKADLDASDFIHVSSDREDDFFVDEGYRDGHAGFGHYVDGARVDPGRFD